MEKNKDNIRSDRSAITGDWSRLVPHLHCIEWLFNLVGFGAILASVDAGSQIFKDQYLTVAYYCLTGAMFMYIYFSTLVAANFVYDKFIKQWTKSIVVRYLLDFICLPVFVVVYGMVSHVSDIIVKTVR